MSRVKAAMLAASATALSTGVSSAVTAAINFVGDGYGALGANVTQDAYGVALADWTNGPDSETGTVFTFGTGSAINGVWTANNDWAQPSLGAGGEGEVNFGYLDDSGDNLTITLSGLSGWLAANSATGYTVQVVQATDNGTGFTNVPMFDFDGGNLLDTLTNSTTGGGGAVGGASSVSSVLTSDTLFLDPDIRAGTVRGTVAAIIVTSVPEPSSTALLGLGGLALMLRRRR